MQGDGGGFLGARADLCRRSRKDYLTQRREGAKLVCLVTPDSIRGPFETDDLGLSHLSPQIGVDFAYVA